MEIALFTSVFLIFFSIILFDIRRFWLQVKAGERKGIVKKSDVNVASQQSPPKQIPNQIIKKSMKQNLKIEFKYANLKIGKTFYTSHICGAKPSTPTQTVKPLVVFLHGFTATVQTWKHIMERIVGSHVDFIGFDFLGHGKSSLPDDGQMSNQVLEQHLLQVLHHFFPSKNLPPLILIGHSQAGTFAPYFALNNPGLVKRVILITPGGIDFQWSDYYHEPFHFFIRNLYQAGRNKMIQSTAIWWSGMNVSIFYSFWKRLDFITIDHLSFLQLSKTTKTILQNYWHWVDDWLASFSNFTSTPEKRKSYYQMVGQMLDNLDLLKDNTPMFQNLAKSDTAIDLIIAKKDFITTLKAGSRLYNRMNPGKESKKLKSMVYASSEHLTQADDVKDVHQPQSKNLNLHVLNGTHFIPVEQPDALCQIIFDAYNFHLSSNSL